MKVSGIINDFREISDSGTREVLLPCAFVGLRLAHSLTLTGAFSEKISLDRFAIEKLLNLSAFQAGQFIIEHQFAGNRCDRAVLFGVFFPLNLCETPKVRDELGRMLDSENLAYDIESPGGFEEAIADFKGIGLPIYEEYDYNGVNFGHGFLKVLNSDQGLAFLRENKFRYVTGIGGMSNAEVAERVKGIPGLIVDPAQYLNEEYPKDPPPKELVNAWYSLKAECAKSRRVSSSARADWKSIADFAAWLSRGPGYEVNPKDVIVSLLYENYD